MRCFSLTGSAFWTVSNSVTLSPVSVAAKGLVSETRGLSLRFPRFVRIREDKSVEDASSTDFLAGMYRAQQGRSTVQGGTDDGQLVDLAPLTDSELDDDCGSVELD